MRSVSKAALAILAGTGCALASTLAWASPVIYKIFAITDVQFAGTMYHNAQVTLTFVGDTGDVVQLPISAPVVGATISKGSARLQIVSGGRRIVAHFTDQLTISVDQTNGGVGFGSTFNGTFNPAYPLAIDGSNVGAFGGGVVPEPDLVTPGSWVDHAWSCLGFPVSAFNGGNGQCPDPSPNNPLHTDRGDFYIYQPYQGAISGGLITDDYDGSINDGVFSIIPGDSQEDRE